MHDFIFSDKMLTAVYSAVYILFFNSSKPKNNEVQQHVQFGKDVGKQNKLSGNTLQSQLKNSCTVNNHQFNGTNRNVNHRHVKSPKNANIRTLMILPFIAKSVYFQVK